MGDVKGMCVTFALDAYKVGVLIAHAFFNVAYQCLPTLPTHARFVLKIQACCFACMLDFA